MSFETVTFELWMLLRLGIAALLTALIGVERERTGKAAGLRTHMLVGVASALFMTISEALLVRGGEGGDAVRIDMLRTIQAVATGVGFLGAGVIFVQREAGRVHGLTTAASIWAASAVGLGIGAGVYVLSTGATLLFYLILRVLRRFEAALDPVSR